MVTVAKKNGIVEWIVLIVTSGLLIGAIGTGIWVGNIQSAITRACENIKRIEDTGTIVSTNNSKDIVGLQVGLMSITERLKRIEDTASYNSQKSDEILDILRRKP